MARIATKNGLRDETKKAGPIDATSKAYHSARNGIQSSEQFAQCMSDLIADLATGKITPEVSNAMVNAGGKLLKVVEMAHRYGVVNQRTQERSLRLAGKD